MARSWVIAWLLVQAAANAASLTAAWYNGVPDTNP